MTFFARPNLDNIQFKQLEGGALTLSGQTQIATVTGLTLTDGSGGYIPIIATGGSNNYVLTYDDSIPSAPVIKLKEPTASGGTGVYPYNESATTTVGGLVAGTNLYNVSVVDILQEILVPTLDPELINPSISSFQLFYSGTSTPLPPTIEAGCSVDVDASVFFCQGSINPVYPPTTSSCRSGAVLCYSFSAFLSTPPPLVTGSLNITYNLGVNQILAGSNLVCSTVCYSAGTQPYDSAGNAYCSPLPTSATTKCSNGSCACIVVNGIYPWYWGKICCAAASGFGRPSVECIKHEITGNTCGGLNTGNKCVGVSTGTIGLNFNSGDSDYIWFATPIGSATKTCWYQSELNKGNIGGTPTAYPVVGSNLFPTPETITGVTAVNGITWISPQSYKVYVSNYQTCSTSTIELRNS